MNILILEDEELAARQTVHSELGPAPTGSTPTRMG